MSCLYFETRLDKKENPSSQCHKEQNLYSSHLPTLSMSSPQIGADKPGLSSFPRQRQAWLEFSFLLNPSLPCLLLCLSTSVVRVGKKPNSQPGKLANWARSGEKCAGIGQGTEKGKDGKVEPNPQKSQEGPQFSSFCWLQLFLRTHL